MLTVQSLVTGFTIASSGNTSNVIAVDSVSLDSLAGAAGVCIYAPAALTGTITVEVSVDGTTFVTLQSGGADVSIGAGKAITLTEISFRHVRLKSSGSEAAQRVFSVSKLVSDGDGD